MPFDVNIFWQKTVSRDTVRFDVNIFWQKTVSRDTVLIFFWQKTVIPFIFNRLGHFSQNLVRRQKQGSARRQRGIYSRKTWMAKVIPYKGSNSFFVHIWKRQLWRYCFLSDDVRRVKRWSSGMPLVLLMTSVTWMMVVNSEGHSILSIQVISN